MCWLKKELSTNQSSPNIEEAAPGESDFMSLEVHSFSIAASLPQITTNLAA